MKKVLIVEDDKKILMALAIRLRAEGIEVHSAQDAMMGLGAAVRVKPDLVLLDISMPAGNGFSLGERIQENVATAGTPMIFITASRQVGLFERAQELGAVGFFEKPYDANQLMHSVRSVLGLSAV